MYTIKKEFTFEASHRLTGLREDHPCMRVHGHSYIIILTLKASNLDKDGFVLDYRNLDQFKKWVDDLLDHQHLNNILPGQPSAENIAKWIYDLWKGVIPYLKAVTVKETQKTSATYEPES